MSGITPNGAEDQFMRPSGTALLLLLPGGVALIALLVLPLFVVVDESFRLFEPGRIGSAENAPYTLQNYREVLANPIYLKYFYDTLRFSLIASLRLDAGWSLGYRISVKRLVRHIGNWLPWYSVCNRSI